MFFHTPVFFTRFTYFQQPKKKKKLHTNTNRLSLPLSRLVMLMKDVRRATLCLHEDMGQLREDMQRLQEDVERDMGRLREDMDRLRENVQRDIGRLRGNVSRGLGTMTWLS